VLPASIILPAFNEELAISREISRIQQVMNATGVEYELIVVDDGSGDDTAACALRSGARVLKHAENRGYGASLKSGIVAATYDSIVISDPDGTYPPEKIPYLLAALENADMVIGARTGQNVSTPLMRRPAKWLLGLLANRIAGQRIPDLNSGMRAFRRDTVIPYFSLLSNRFSFTTTITLALLAEEYRLVYLPIDYYKRTGKSKITPWHFMEFIILILRMAVLFQPLRVFLPIAFTLGAFGVTKAIFDITVFLATRVSDSWSLLTEPILSTSALLMMGAALQMLVLGLIADGVIRRLIQQKGPPPASHAVRFVETVAATDKTCGD
jgi:glycosyltransferase involved in cell wall biosynthesis